MKSRHKALPSIAEKKIDAGGFNLFFRVFEGIDNINIVFIPGMGFDSSEWEAVQKSASERTGCQTIAYDPMGYGLSDYGPAEYDITNDMRFLKTGLNNLGVKGNIILVAHSYGAFIARLLARYYPEEVKGVVLVEPATVGFNYTIGLDNLAPKDSSGYSDADKRIMSEYPVSTVTMKDEPDFATDLAVTVVTRGKKLWPPEMSRYDDLWLRFHESIVEGYPYGKLVIAENSGHIVPLEEPDVITQEIDSMIFNLNFR